MDSVSKLTAGKGRLASPAKSLKVGKLLEGLIRDTPEYPSVKGGRKEARNTLRRLSKLSDYAIDRDIPSP